MNAPARLRPDLADTDFDRLFAAARAAIPKYAPQWTDHNTHDPGIMLLELAAFVADAQIYSLARLRRDERAALAALFGVRARGPLPAGGMIRPFAPIDADSAQWLAQGTTLECELHGAPPFRLRERVNLSAARLQRIATRYPDGRIEVHDDANLRSGAAWYPFGRAASSAPNGGASAQLWLDLSGPLFDPKQAALNPARRGYLCLGVEVPPNPDAPAFDTDEVGDWHDAGEAAGPLPGNWDDNDFFGDDVASNQAAGNQDTGNQDAGNRSDPRAACVCSPLSARLHIGVVDYALPIVRDDSAGMRRSGVIVFDLSALPADAHGPMRVVLRTAAGRHTTAALVLRVDLNCLPVEQVQRVTLPKESGFGTGLPDQSYRLDAPDWMYAESANGLQAALQLGFEVSGARHLWQASQDLSDALPAETVYQIDPASRVIRFGNGINGACAPQGASLLLQYHACAGRAGNLARGFRWALPGGSGSGEWFGSNPLPMSGGDDPMDDDRARRIARARVRRAHACVTDADIEAAALSHPELQVVRAQMLASNSPTVRTLLAVFVGEDAGAPAASSTPTSADFIRARAALQAALQPRCLLGTVLQVIGPRFVTVSVEAELRIAQGLDPEEVESACRDGLTAWLRVVPDPRLPGATLWPLGRALTVLDLKAQLRSVAGVRAVPQCRWIVAGQPVSDSQVRLLANDLPRYHGEDDRLTFKVKP